jgi:hypothetical protein
VSSVCGNADGKTECGTGRELSFKNKLTGQQITVADMPYFGWSYDPVLGNANFDPTKAAAYMVLTVTISLSQYPTV